MPSIILECPHCLAEKVGFSIIYERKTIAPGLDRFQTLMICSNCDGPVIGQFERRMGPDYQSPKQCDFDPRQFGFALSAIFPRPAAAKLPNHIPNDELKNYFGQAADCLRRGNWDASGAMSRKVVDVSTQLLLGADATKYNDIKTRIDALAKRNTLTPDLQEWAHQVRLGGNDAAHDKDPFTRPEAVELLDFTELYLTYVYTLPGKLAERRARAAAAKAPQP